jgi:hypothetical protein
LRLGKPIINQYACMLSDGREVDVVSFEAKVLKAAGQIGSSV